MTPQSAETLYICSISDENFTFTVHSHIRPPSNISNADINGGGDDGAQRHSRLVSGVQNRPDMSEMGVKLTTWKIRVYTLGKNGICKELCQNSLLFYSPK